MQRTGWADATSELDRNQAQQTDTKQKQAWTLEVWHVGLKLGRIVKLQLLDVKAGRILQLQR